jgi:integrase
MGLDTAISLIPTYKVISRHSAQCPHKDEGREYIKCGCRKHISVYDPRIEDPKKRQDTIKTKTRSWADAELIAQAYRDKLNPDKQRAAEAEARLQAIQAEKQSQTATIEKAVAKFLVFKKNNPSRRSSRRSGPTADSTMETYRILLGDVDPTSLKVKRTGQLLNWLETQTPRPLLISDLTQDKVDDFRATWKFGSDLTTANTWTRLKTFFDYCKNAKWIKEHPFDGRTRPTVQEGGRTTAFTDSQYKTILDTLADQEAKTKQSGTPKTQFETEKKLADIKRLLTLVELMRWGGLALHDAVNFKLTALSGDVLEYRRQKTNRKAKPILPGHVVDLLRTVIPINGDPNQPFRDISKKIGSDKNYWSRHLKELFSDAGIETVTTDIGREREPHAHMLRDTFAVGQLERHIRDGKPSLKSIADAMGDSVQVMLKHYAPVIEKLEKAHEEEQRKVVSAQIAELTKQTEQADVIVIGGRK